MKGLASALEGGAKAGNAAETKYPKTVLSSIRDEVFLDRIDKLGLQ